MVELQGVGVGLVKGRREGEGLTESLTEDIINRTGGFGFGLGSG